MAGIRGIVDGPDFVALPNALWDAAQHPAQPGPHWQQGVTWTDWCGGAQTTYADECIAVTGTDGAVPAAPPLEPTASGVDRGATAFTVYAAFDCSLIGLPDVDQAAEALARSEAFQVSRAFWTGQAGGQTTVWPHLAADDPLDDPQGIRLQTGADTVLAATDDAAVAIGRLDGALAEQYGGLGAVHVPVAALATLKARSLVREDDGVLRTPGGNLIVAAAGYTGTGPDGAVPPSGSAWIYATGALFGYRSDVAVRDFPGTFDRSTNTVRKQASRTYLFGWECAHLAALMTLGVPS
ncbi:hypothetical protein [Streptomyces africanus]|uniref:hypothetical protein n=1 Tax=Streptomyces africanus TaxID=231024 RepID=UPI000A3625F4|nr:hypothetical protein [Streptomyces africanus]